MGMCIWEKEKYPCAFVLFSSFVYLFEWMCLYILLSVPFNLSLASCLFLLSQSSFSPQPPIHQFTLRTPPISLTHHYFLLLPGSYIFRPLSTSQPPPFLCSLLSLWSWRPFFLSLLPLSLPTSALHSWKPDCSNRALFSPLLLSVLYLPSTPFTCILISVGLSCLSLCLWDPYLFVYFMSPWHFPRN